MGLDRKVEMLMVALGTGKNVLLWVGKCAAAFGTSWRFLGTNA